MTPRKNDIPFLRLCNALYELHLRFQPSQIAVWLRRTLLLLGKLIPTVAEFSPGTGGALRDCRRAMTRHLRFGELGDFHGFTQLWGRGQQYASFIRHDCTLLEHG